MNKERYYDPKEMFKYAFFSIKTIVISVIIGALLGVGFCFASNKAKVADQPKVQESEATLQSAKEELSDNKIADTEATYKTYKSLENQENNLQNYMEKSVYLNLDESTAESNTIVFSVSGNSKSSAIVSSYAFLVKNNDLFKNINNTLKTNIGIAYLSELVNVNEGVGNSSIVVNTENTHDESFIVTIVGKNSQQCKGITQCVKKRINQVTPHLKKSFGNFNVSNSGDTYGPVAISDITSKRKDYNDKLNYIESTMVTLINGLDDNQRNYFNALIDNNASTLDKSNKTTLKTHLNYSALIIAAVGGAIMLLFVLVIFRIVKYILDKKVHNEKEFVSYFGLNVIAVAEENKKIDENIITEEINFISKKDNNEKIGLLSSLIDNNFENTIYQRLKNDNVNCEIIPSVPESKDDFDKLLTVGKAVIFEKIGSSNVNNVEKMLHYYELKNIQIIGAVLIK